MFEDKNMIYAAVCWIAILAGSFLSGYGPMIPFYSEATGYDETHYSYLMFARGSGALIGLSTIKYLPNYFNSKALIIIFTAVSGVSFYASYLSLNDWNLMITYTLMSASATFINGMVFGVIFQLFPKDPTFFISLRSFMFGVGGLLGPFNVGWF